MNLRRTCSALLLALLSSACIGPLAPYEPLLSPLLPEPNCTEARVVDNTVVPGRCEVGVSVPVPDRHR